MQDIKKRNKVLSIVTINLNNDKGLSRTLESISNQDYLQDIEIIVIDGNSSDDSEKIIKSNHKIISKNIIEPDKGIFDAMNKGLEIATGKFTYFLNSGDIFYNDNVLTNLIPLLNDLPDQIFILNGFVDSYFKDLELGLCDASPWLSHQAAIVRTDKLKHYKFDTKLDIFGDLDLWKRMKMFGHFIKKDVDLIIARMEKDGVGSHPKYAYKRFLDKQKLSKKHGEHKLITNIAILFLTFFYYKMFGLEDYYKNFPNLIRKFKRILKT